MQIELKPETSAKDQKKETKIGPNSPTGCQRFILKTFLIELVQTDGRTDRWT